MSDQSIEEVQKMIHKGSTAIKYLAKKQKLDDSAASSHWQEYHRDFSFGDQGFFGLRGFGVHGSRKLGFLHSIMQRRFREMGQNFDSYESFFHLAQNIVRSQQRVLDLDVMRNVLSLSLLSQEAPQAFGTDRTVSNGDGNPPWRMENWQEQRRCVTL